jgi:hypothetical protein
MYSPMKTGYGSGNLLAPMRRMQRSSQSRWDPASQPRELPELRSSFEKVAASGSHTVPENQLIGVMSQILSEPDPIERLSNVERTTIKVVQPYTRAATDCAYAGGNAAATAVAAACTATADDGNDDDNDDDDS